MAYPWTFNSQDITILPGGETDEQAVSLTVRQVPYGGLGEGTYILDTGGLGPETIGLTLWFANAAAYASFRSGAVGVGTTGPLNWMLGTVPEAYLKSLSLKTIYTTPDLPVEARATFVVSSPITGSGSTSYNSAYPWSYTPSGGSQATLIIPGSPALSDDYPTEEATRQLPGSGTGPSWYVDASGPGMETIKVALYFTSAANFLNFRLKLLGSHGALVYPLGSVTDVLLSKLAITKIALASGYPVFATADFLVIQP